MTPILSPTQTRILIYLFEHPSQKLWISRIAKEIKGTITCVNNGVSNLNHLGLVEKVSEGRVIYCKLTLKGIQVARLIIKIKEVIK